MQQVGTRGVRQRRETEMMQMEEVVPHQNEATRAETRAPRRPYRPCERALARGTASSATGWLDLFIASHPHLKLYPLNIRFQCPLAVNQVYDNDLFVALSSQMLDWAALFTLASIYAVNQWDRYLLNNLAGARTIDCD